MLLMTLMAKIQVSRAHFIKEEQVQTSLANKTKKPFWSKTTKWQTSISKTTKINENQFSNQEPEQTSEEQTTNK